VLPGGGNVTTTGTESITGSVTALTTTSSTTTKAPTSSVPVQANEGPKVGARDVGIEGFMLGLAGLVMAAL
jgi:hypothetical protein